MPTAAVRATLCTALLATPLLALAQSAILPQQRDAAGNVMEPLGQVLIASETGPSGLYDCTRDGNWCVRVQPVAEEGNRPTVLEVLEKAPGQGKPHTYHVSIDVPQESELSLWPWIVRLAPGVGSDEPVTDPQQRVRQNVLVDGIVKFSTMYSGGGADASTLQLARVRHLQDDIQVDDDVLTVPWLGNAMIRAVSASRTSSSAPVPATTNTGSRRSWRWIRLPRACRCCATRPWRPGTRPVFRASRIRWPGGR